MDLEVQIEDIDEIWKPCVGYEDKYMVSNYGRVKSLPYTYYYPTTNKRKFMKEKIKKQCESGKRKGVKQGYLCTRISDKNGKSIAKMVHILVAQAFIPNPDGLPTVNHKDGNKHNNRVDNLEWVTFSENNQHAYNNNLKTDNQILIRTKNNIISDIYISESDASLKTGYSRRKIVAFCDKNLVDDYGYEWHRFIQDKYSLGLINIDI